MESLADRHIRHTLIPQRLVEHTPTQCLSDTSQSVPTETCKLKGADKMDSLVGESHCLVGSGRAKVFNQKYFNCLFYNYQFKLMV